MSLGNSSFSTKCSSRTSTSPQHTHTKHAHTKDTRTKNTHTKKETYDVHEAFSFGLLPSA